MKKNYRIHPWKIYSKRNAKAGFPADQKKKKARGKFYQ